MLAHRHWITFHAFGKKLHLCARCSGIVGGFLTLKTLLLLPIILTDPSPSFFIGFPLSLLLALPSILDWTTQNLEFRQSTNNLRLLTGFFEGIGVGVFSLIDLASYLKLFILTAIGLGVLSVGFVGKKIVMYTASRS